MRTHTFFNSVDASINQTSDVFRPDCGQDFRFLLQVTKSGTDGNPKLFIEESIDGTVWTCLTDTDELDDSFLLDQSPIGIKDSYFMGDFMRLRIEPNGNTTGTVTAKMGYKTKV